MYDGWLLSPLFSFGPIAPQCGQMSVCKCIQDKLWPPLASAPFRIISAAVVPVGRQFNYYDVDSRGRFWLCVEL